MRMHFPITPLLALLCASVALAQSGPLSAPIRAEDPTALQEALKADPKAARVADVKGWTPLHEAARVGTVASVTALLEAGAAVGAPARMGTPEVEHGRLQAGGRCDLRCLGAELRSVKTSRWTHRCTVLVPT